MYVFPIILIYILSYLKYFDLRKFVITFFWIRTVNGCGEFCNYTFWLYTVNGFNKFQQAPCLE